jgi:hypothetical protein
MKPIFLFLTTWFLSPCSISQSLRKPVTSSYTGLGTYSKQQADVFSFINNQASLAQMKNAEAGFYTEKRFLLKELSLYQAAFVLPSGVGNFGVSTGYYGFTGYNETQVGLAYAIQLGKKVDIGIQFNYFGIKIPGYGSAGTVNGEAGLIMHLTDQLHAGLHLYNPAGGKIGKYHEEQLASVYTVGIGYDASEKFFISTGIEKEENQPVNVNAGFQYKFLPQILTRAGIATGTSTAWMGAGYNFSSFRIDATAAYHPRLGITPGMMLLFHFNGSAGKQLISATE